MKVLKYIKFRSTQDKLVLKNDTTLDIIYSYSEKLEKYRISILDLDEINSLLNLLHKRKNNIIFSILVSKIQNKESKHINIIHKQRSRGDVIDINEFNINFLVEGAKKYNCQSIIKFLKKKK